MRIMGNQDVQKILRCLLSLVYGQKATQKNGHPEKGQNHANIMSLTKDQSRQIEHIQKRALRIIFNSNCIDYKKILPGSSHHSTNSF